MTIVLPICREYSVCKQLYLLFHIWRGIGKRGSYGCSSHVFRLIGRGKKYLSLISLDDVCSGKEALRKGTEALNKSNRIMSNTTISADEGHFELSKSICMANNHIHLQLQIIQPFLPDEAGIFLQLVSIPSAAVSRIPASRPSTSW